MKHRLLIAAATTAFAVSLGAQNPQPAQQAQPAQPRPAQTPNADPYANNPDAGKTQFPLAAPAGKDSGAKQNGPAGAANQGAFDPAKWKYGTAFDAPAGSKIWPRSPPARPSSAAGSSRSSTAPIWRWPCLLYTSPSPRDS